MKRSSYSSWRCIIAVLLFCLLQLGLLLGHPVLAAPEEVPTLAALQARVDSLEARVEKLEGLLSQRPVGSLSVMPETKPAPAHSDWRSLNNWGRVKLGMSFDQVTLILGRPTRSDMTGPDTGSWYYEGYVGSAGTNVSGNLFFVNRQVLSVRPPVW